MTKKLLFLTSELPPQPGGIGTHANQLAHYLSKSYEVEVIADQRSGSGQEERAFDQKSIYKIRRVQRYKVILLTYILRILASLKAARQSDVILVSGKFSLWQVHVLKFFYKKPVIAVIHGSEVLLANKHLRQLTDQALEKCDHVIAVSSYTLNLVKHLQLKETSVIPNAIEINNQMPPLIKIKDITAPQLITVGNLTQRKGQHNMINALPELLKKYPDLHYHCVGIPTEIDRLKQLAKDLKVSQAITFHGRVSEEKKNELYQKSHLFVMLSEKTQTGDVEGFGIAILEANVFGLPALGSLNSGIEDAIKQNYSGRLVNPHAGEDITSAIDDILENHSLYQQKAQEWVQSFQWEEIIKNYEKVISAKF
ncbi:MAG: glycosyltransferase family 4 protein [Psychroflexus sp.]